MKTACYLKIKLPPNTGNDPILRFIAYFRSENITATKQASEKKEET
jgi:hypothetical protein